MKNRRYFEFGEFLLHESERTLFRNGTAVQLTPKAFDTLLKLVENAGSLVEKDEIMRAVWPDSFVEETGLARNISVLRKVLGKDEGSEKFIETVPKRGYRFVAEVSQKMDYDQAPSPSIQVDHSSATEPEDAGSATDLAVVAKPTLLKWQIAMILTLLVVTIGVGLGYRRFANRTATVDKSSIRSIAVLPFERLDNIDDNDRLGIGMSDTLITRLGNIQQLSIRPTRDVMKYEHVRQDIAETGMELGVDAVLDGSIQRSGDRIRVTVRLIHTATKTQLWAAQFDDRLSDIFTMQDIISDQVARSLSLQLTEAEQRRLNKKYTEDFEAYQAYLKGRYFLNKRTREDLDKTIDYFKEAIRHSPNYALAFSGLADAYSTRANRSRASANREQAYLLARQAASKAVSIDDDLAEAHASLGIIARNADWNWLESEKALKHAIDLNPNYPTAHQYYALLLASVGRIDEALSEITTAQRLDPLSPVINGDLAEIYIFARRPQQAIEISQKALEVDPGNAKAQRMLMWAYLESGAFDEAIRYAQTAPDAGTESQIFPMSIQGCAYAATGQRQKALEIVDELLALTEQYSPPLVQAAIVYLELGETEKAFSLIEKALAVKDDRLLWIKVNPRFERLRSDGRYKALLNRLNLPW